MRAITSRWITSAAFDEIACGIVSGLLLLACTTLVAKMMPELGRPLVVILWASVTAAWGVLGWEAWVIGRRFARRSGS